MARRAARAGEDVMADQAAVFDEHRSVLMGAAYRVLGSVHDAEDVVQEAWLRWADVDLDQVREPRAYLVTMTTRLALNRARQVQRQREDYIGPWLPEPVSQRPSGEDSVELAESVSMAMLVVLASLSPLERAAFVLKEVFDLPFAEIASTLGRSEASVRQLAHRAREHVHARAPRQPVDEDTHKSVTERFLQAAQGGSLTDLLELMTPDVVLYSDGGGKKRAALRPLVGPDKIMRWAAGTLERPDVPGLTLRLSEVNGRPAILVVAGQVVDSVIVLELDEHLVTEIYVIRNPDKLSNVTL